MATGACVASRAKRSRQAPRRSAAAFPRFALEAALAIPSTNGKELQRAAPDHGEKPDRQLSEVYEDFHRPGARSENRCLPIAILVHNGRSDVR